MPQIIPQTTTDTTTVPDTTPVPDQPAADDPAGIAATIAAAVATTTATGADPAGVRLVHDLVGHVPSFEDAYASHVFRQGEVLPHVFFWDVVQATVRSFLARDDARDPEPDWRRTLDFLEERCGRGDAVVDEVIVTSFLGDLPSPHEPGHGIVDRLGPVMAARFDRVRPTG
ncbi:hypothetical protein [Streptomyces termitum]|uniref:hypothetical protein n=1 Tax=Streptomyces termitum TaxID=67368 RepID=UPI0033B1CA16